MIRFSGYVRLIRPVNCLLMGFAVITGSALANPNVSSIYSVNPILGFITGFLLTAAAMGINDYYDREIDAINELNRPIPGGLINPNEAFAFAFVLTALGFVTAYLTNLLCFTLAIIAWLLLVAYTTFGKRTGLFGNFLVSICVAIPFIYGSFTVTNTLELKVLLFSLMAFLSNTGREITKGIVDAEGDKMHNVKTLAVRLGAQKAAVAAAFFYLSAILLTPIPWFLNVVSLWFIPLVAVFDVGLMVSSFWLLKNSSKENARKIKKFVLLWFIIGLLAFVIGALK